MKEDGFIRFMQVIVAKTFARALVFCKLPSLQLLFTSQLGVPGKLKAEHISVSKTEQQFEDLGEPIRLLGHNEYS